MHCGQCADACHFYRSLGRSAAHARPTSCFPSPRPIGARNFRLPGWGWRRKITEADLKEWEELLFDTCTMCGRCTTICPMGIDIASIVGGARQAFVAAGLGPEDLLQAADNSRDHGSPLGVTPGKAEGAHRMARGRARGADRARQGQGRHPAHGLLHRDDEISRIHRRHGQASEPCRGQLDAQQQGL